MKKSLTTRNREDIVIRLKNRYPESVITDTFDITTRNAGTVDAVVALTKDISHSDYLKYKQKCKNLGLPFIHSPSENVERIAQDIFESGVLPEIKYNVKFLKKSDILLIKEDKICRMFKLKLHRSYSL